MTSKYYIFIVLYCIYLSTNVIIIQANFRKILLS
uniref:Uncharacterized protein n=1 Tax=Thuretia quercifolia TaxID=189650 RepID=A0A1Z1MKZ9_9FLOR|nr:hypothetical protein [Thuretia quercifolia]ARW66421.1 hypothetical protein [Thuretia quercifolia]